MRFPLVAMFIAGALTCGAPAVQANSEHDNYVTFAISSLQDFHFYMESYSLAGGQPWGGVSSWGQNNVGTIDVVAGREQTSEVATWFKQQVGSGQMFACSQGSSTPDALNFAVSGAMSITANQQTISCPIVLAQGNKATINNWWIGAPNLKNNVLTCAVAKTGAPVQATINTTNGGGCSNSFVLNP